MSGKTVGKNGNEKKKETSALSGLGMTYAITTAVEEWRKQTAEQYEDVRKGHSSRTS